MKLEKGPHDKEALVLLIGIIILVALAVCTFEWGRTVYKVVLRR